MNAKKRGDTIIEVIFAITVFAAISIAAIALMNSGVNTAMATMDITMARAEIDAQAEALRFVQNSYIASKGNDGGGLNQVWRKIVDMSVEQNQLPEYSLSSCSDVYENPSNVSKMFAMNTRLLMPDMGNLYGYDEIITGVGTYAALIPHIVKTESNPSNPSTFKESGLYPRLIFSKGGGSGVSGENTSSGQLAAAGDLYRAVSRVEGIWIMGVKSEKRDAMGQPEYYDFHIRTCWNAAGRPMPTTIGTIVRLYNPEGTR